MSGMIDDAAGIEPALGFVPTEAQIARREMLGQLARSKTFLIGSFVVAFWVFWGIVGAQLTPDDPLGQSESVLAPPSSAHWFGTDQLGRDVFSRVLAGASDTLSIAPLATLLGIVAGTCLGLITGFWGGSWADDTISRVIDAVLALPLIVIAVLALTGLGSSNSTLIIVIGFVFTPIVARTVRATVLGERDLDYVQAARLTRVNARPTSWARRSSRT